MQTFILAGGFATRLWPLTEKRAKPLLPLAGKPLLTHLIEKIPAGMPITVSTNQAFAKDFEKWRDDLRASSTGHPTVTLSGASRKASGDEGVAGWPSAQHDRIKILIEDAGHEGEKLGALGAVAKWVREEKINEDILLLAGDNYIGFSVEEFLKAYRGHPLLAAYDIRDTEKAKQLGTVIPERKTLRCFDETQHRLCSGQAPNEQRKTETVAAFEEKPQHPRSTLVSTGCFVLPASTLATLLSYAREKPDNIGGIFEHFLKVGMPVECLSFTEPWFDIGSFEAYLEATKALVGNNILEMYQYTSILVQSPRSTPRQENGNQFEGSVVLGKGSNVRKSTLRNVVLFEDCDIEDCILENCILDNGCTLKGVDLTGKMLRENTKLVRST